jgi:hypothetical protein
MGTAAEESASFIQSRPVCLQKSPQHLQERIEPAVSKVKVAWIPSVCDDHTGVHLALQQVHGKTQQLHKPRAWASRGLCWKGSPHDSKSRVSKGHSGTRAIWFSWQDQESNSHNSVIPWARLAPAYTFEPQRCSSSRKSWLWDPVSLPAWEQWKCMLYLFQFMSRICSISNHWLQGKGRFQDGLVWQKLEQNNFVLSTDKHVTGNINFTLQSSLVLHELTVN